MNLIIFGPPGSGKGTYASRLEPILAVTRISTGDLIRDEMKKNSELGQKMATFVNKGELAPDEMTNEVLKNRLSQADVKKGIIFDGYPRNVDQANFLEPLIKIDAIVKLNVSKDIIVARLSARRVCKKCGGIYNALFLKPKVEGICDKCGGELIQRDDDKPEVIAERFDVYENQSAPVLEFYKRKGAPFVEVTTPSVDTQPEEMVEKILDGLKKLKLK